MSQPGPALRRAGEGEPNPPNKQAYSFENSGFCAELQTWVLLDKRLTPPSRLFWRRLWSQQCLIALFKYFETPHEKQFQIIQTGQLGTIAISELSLYSMQKKKAKSVRLLYNIEPGQIENDGPTSKNNNS